MFPLSPGNAQDGNVAKSGGRTLGIASRDLGSVLSCGEGADAQRPVPAQVAEERPVDRRQRDAADPEVLHRARGACGMER